MTYAGGKNGAGVYQRIINHMPPHKSYIEACLGSGAVLRNKRLAERNIGIDMSLDALDLCLELAGDVRGDLSLLHGNALELLPMLETAVTNSKLIHEPDTLVYFDPPYLMETRKAGRCYEFEMSDEDHETLLDIALNAKCMVMISGYRSDLYDDALHDFWRIDYQAQTRRGMVTESLWMNFKPPVALHDYSHLGDNCRQREAIKRKKARWQGKFQKMPRQERLAIMEALISAED